VPQQPSARTPRQPKILTHDPATANTWESAVEQFLAKGASNNFSPATLAHYRWILLGPRLRAFRTDHGIEAPGDFTADRLDDLKTELLKAGLAVNSVHGFHRATKTFLRWCLKTDVGLVRNGKAALYGVEDTVSESKAPRLPKDVEIETFSLEEEKALLRVARNPRDRMLVEFMLHTGLRLAEVCAVTLDDIEATPDGPYVRVRRGKGDKGRWVPMNAPGIDLGGKVAKFVKNDRDDSADRHLFLGSRKRGGRNEYVGLQPRAVQMILRRLGDAAGVTANPHKFRHTWGTRSVARGVNPLYLKAAMGHATLAMTDRYVHARKADMLIAWSK
jgi:site-specific recombinase XerD